MQQCALPLSPLDGQRERVTEAKRRGKGKQCREQSQICKEAWGIDGMTDWWQGTPREKERERERQKETERERTREGGSEHTSVGDR